MKTLALIVFFFFLLIELQAQSITSLGISVASNSSKAEGKQMYYVVGQLSAFSLGTKKTNSNPTTKPIATSIDSLSYQIKTYPNPATDKVYVQFSKSVPSTSLSFYNTLGMNLSHLIRATSTTTYQINLTTLSQGEYIIKVTTASQTTNTFKIIKQN